MMTCTPPPNPFQNQSRDSELTHRNCFELISCVNEDLIITFNLIEKFVSMMLETKCNYSVSFSYHNCQTHKELYNRQNAVHVIESKVTLKCITNDSDSNCSYCITTYIIHSLTFCI